MYINENYIHFHPFLLLFFLPVPRHGAMTAAVSHAQVTMTAPTTQSTTMIALTMGRPPSPGGGGGNNSSGSDTDGIVNSPSSTALRRLYFKSGRNARTRAPTATVTPAAATSAVPKVSSLQ